MRTGSRNGFHTAQVAATLRKLKSFSCALAPLLGLRARAWSKQCYPTRDQPVLADCLRLAAFHGAEETVKCLLRVGTDPQCTDADGYTPLLMALFANGWDGTRIRGHEKTLDDTPRRWETRISSACSYDTERRLTPPRGLRKTPLMVAARFSGFTSLGVIRELLRGGAPLDAVDTKGRTAEAIARRTLQKPIYDRPWPRISERPDHYRRPGAVEAFLELCAAVRAAGSWKRYARTRLASSSSFCASSRRAAARWRRAVSPRASSRRGVDCRRDGQPRAPRCAFWKILEFAGARTATRSVV